MNPWNSASESLTDERIEALRQKIEDGEYNAAAVAETVARSIIRRGDLRAEGRDQRGIRADGRDPFGPIVH